jgi:hypothetical protein
MQLSSFLRPFFRLVKPPQYNAGSVFVGRADSVFPPDAPRAWEGVRKHILLTPSDTAPSGDILCFRGFRGFDFASNNEVVSGT